MKRRPQLRRPVPRVHRGYICRCAECRRASPPPRDPLNRDLFEGTDAEPVPERASDSQPDLFNLETDQ